MVTHRLKILFSQIKIQTKSNFTNLNPTPNNANFFDIRNTANILESAKNIILKFIILVVMLLVLLAVVVIVAERSRHSYTYLELQKSTPTKTVHILIKTDKHT